MLNAIQYKTIVALGGIVALSVCLLQTGCGKGGGGSSDTVGKAVIQNKGSDTMVNLAQSWAEAYSKVAPDVSVEVSGGGSGVGIAALSRGTIDIANSSRDIKPAESEDTKRSTGREPKEFTAGYDALAIYVHKDNPVEELTFEQLTGIYAEDGKITKWSDLGVKVPNPAHDTIIRISRQSSSGTYEFFREHVMQNKDFKLGSRDMNGSKEVVELVGRTPGAIGYSGMGYATHEVKMVRVAEKTGTTAYPPTVENTMNKAYPIARAMHLYTLGEPEGAVRDYIHWILSDAGQRIVEDTGYVPIAPEKRTK